MKLQALLVGLFAISVALSGCTSESGDGTPSETDGGAIDLGNQGAINGLMVDDNYRPVQLKEEWGSQGPGDFQDIGFILILETAQRFETNENGEFQALPLDPGTYTLRVAADNHEAIDKKVQVVAGEYTEATVEARRQFSTGGTVLSQEQVIFVACAFQVNTPTGGYAAIAAIPGCGGDLSGDSERFDFWSDFTSLKNDVRGLVTEMYASQDGYYGVDIRIFEDMCDHNTLGDCHFSEPKVDDGRYIHTVLYPDRQLIGNGPEYLEPGQEGYCDLEIEEDDCRRYGFSLDYPIQTALFTNTPTRYYEDQVGEIGPLTTGSAGFATGIKAQFIQSVFLYELPGEGIQDYCVLCDEATIPE